MINREKSITGEGHREGDIKFEGEKNTKFLK